MKSFYSNYCRSQPFSSQNNECFMKNGANKTRLEQLLMYAVKHAGIGTFALTDGVGQQFNRHDLQHGGQIRVLAVEGSDYPIFGTIQIGAVCKYQTFSAEFVDKINDTVYFLADNGIKIKQDAAEVLIDDLYGAVDKLTGSKGKG